MSLIRGDAIALPLADESVDLIVTSPPYFALRSYTDGGEHYAGQIGSEPTPHDFLEALWAVTRECVRVLKPSGSIWVNLGDKYAERAGPGREARWIGSQDNPAYRKAERPPRKGTPGIRAKSLMGLPWRYAIGCVDDLDLILRAEVVWSKPNGLPESVTDRVRRSHEQWFMFTKEPRYFSAVDEIREPVVTPTKILPLSPLGVGPADTLAPLGEGTCHECGAVVELFALPDHEGPDRAMEDLRASGADEQRRAGLVTPIPLFVEADAEAVEDAPALVEDGRGAVVDGDAKVRRSVPAVAQGDGALAVDDASEPSKVGLCSGCHPLIVPGRYDRNEVDQPGATGERHAQSNPLGKLPGSVWSIPSEPLKVPDWLGVDHFAAFPQEWPRRIILGWSPSGICTACGEGRRPVVDTERVGGRIRTEPDSTAVGAGRAPSGHMAPGALSKFRTEATITGYACACDVTLAPTRPAVVLDPFGGTGTVAMVARALGRYPVHLDLSADYLRLARWRIYDSGHAAKSTARTNRERQGTLL